MSAMISAVPPQPVLPPKMSDIVLVRFPDGFKGRIQAVITARHKRKNLAHRRLSESDLCREAMVPFIINEERRLKLVKSPTTKERNGHDRRKR